MDRTSTMTVKLTRLFCEMDFSQPHNKKKKVSICSLLLIYKVVVTLTNNFIAKFKNITWTQMWNHNYSRVKTISLEETTVICLVYFQVQKFKSALDPVQFLKAPDSLKMKVFISCNSRSISHRMPACLFVSLRAWPKRASTLPGTQ